jgi:hypothetical protein
MSLRALILALLAVSGAFSQTSQSSSSVIPDAVLYRAFLVRVVWLDDVARQIDAKGQDGSDARHRIRKEAGLTPAEEERLKSIAQRWKEQNDAIGAQLRALGKPDGTMSNPKRAEQLAGERDQVVMDRVNELKAAFELAKSEQMDKWIRATSPVRSGTSGGRSGGAR